MSDIVQTPFATPLRTAANLVAALFFGVVVLGILGLLLAKVPFDDWLLGASSSHVGTTRRAVLAAGLVAVSVYGGAVLCRVLARLIPLRSDQRPRYFVIASHLLALAICFAPLTFISWPDAQRDRARENLEKEIREHPMEEDLFDARIAMLGVEAMGGAVIYQFTIYVFFLVVVPLTLSLWRHIRRPKPSGVLFLRRFGSLAEASLMSAIMRLAPKDAELAFISSPGGVPASWDPVSLSLSGLPWLRPWSRIPIYLRTSDDTWATEVASLISRSRIIVFDTSELSDSVRLEWNLIVELGAEPRTLLLEPLGTVFVEGKNAQRATYDCSWPAAVPRLLVGTLVASSAGFIAAGYLGALLGVLAVMLPIGHKSLTRQASASLRNALAVASAIHRRPQMATHSTERTDA